MEMERLNFLNKERLVSWNKDRLASLILQAKRQHRKAVGSVLSAAERNGDKLSVTTTVSERHLKEIWRTEVEWGAYGSRRHTRWSEEWLFYIAWTVTAAWGAFHFDQIGPALKVICIVFGFMFLAAVDLLHQLLKTDHRLRSFYSTAVEAFSTVYGVGEEYFYLAVGSSMWQMKYSDIHKVFVGNGYQGLFIDFEHKRLGEGYGVKYTLNCPGNGGLSEITELAEIIHAKALQRNGDYESAESVDYPKHFFVPGSLAMFQSQR